VCPCDTVMIPIQRSEGERRSPLVCECPTTYGKGFHHYCNYCQLRDATDERKGP